MRTTEVSNCFYYHYIQDEEDTALKPSPLLRN